jgi:hypothetical protein
VRERPKSPLRSSKAPRFHNISSREARNVARELRPAIKARASNEPSTSPFKQLILAICVILLVGVLHACGSFRCLRGGYPHPPGVAEIRG